MCQWIAASCICDPITETIWPIHNKRKSRWRSDAKALWRSVFAESCESDARFVSGIDEPIYIGRRLRTKRTLGPKQKKAAQPLEPLRTLFRFRFATTASALCL